jgi:hypothetical protein
MLLLSRLVGHVSARGGALSRAGWETFPTVSIVEVRRTVCLDRGDDALEEFDTARKTPGLAAAA